jgi:hypothetical protein
VQIVLIYQRLDSATNYQTSPAIYRRANVSTTWQGKPHISHVINIPVSRQFRESQIIGWYLFNCVLLCLRG